MLIEGVFVISFLPILMGDVRVECALPMQSLHERPPLLNLSLSFAFLNNPSKFTFKLRVQPFALRQERSF